MAQLLQLTCKHFHPIRDRWLLCYTFLTIFQPPLLPIPFIYILGGFTLIWFLDNHLKKRYLTLARNCRLIWFIEVLGLYFLYLVCFGVIDMSIVEKGNTIMSRLRSINQLIILSFLDFTFVLYLLIQFNRKSYQLNDILTLILFAGLIQSFFALSAFLSPSLRNLYMLFGDTNLYNNAFFMERRGYGFSMNLIDTFGYGMGLIAGYSILYRWTSSKTLRLVTIALLLFTIIINARTGIVIFVVALIVRLCIKSNLRKSIYSCCILMLTLMSVWSLIPLLLETGRKSQNQTISWISSSFTEMYYLLETSNNSNSIGMEDVRFLDNFVGLPDNIFTLFFGTGHFIYDTTATMGFRTDIGYLNLFWEFGIIGGSFFLLFIIYWLLQPFFRTHNLLIKRVIIFNTISYALVLMKAILLGFNPGTMVNYIVIFSIYFVLVYQSPNQNEQKRYASFNHYTSL